MALPTAATIGYTSYPGVVYGPDVACVDLAEWLYWFRKLCKVKGYGDPVVWQTTGANENSGGTHSQGGVWDVGGLGNARAMLAREMGAVAWPRDWTNNRHTHGVLDCQHNEPARYQRAACIVYRKNGLGYMGLAGPDPLPAPSKWRRWYEGIDWAKAEIARITGEQILESISTSEEDELMAITVKHPILGTQVPLSDALWSMWTYILEQRDDPDETARKVWEQTVTRDGKQINVKQELADSKSIALRVEQVLAGLGSKVTDLDAAVEALPDSPELAAVKAAVDALRVVVEEAHPKAEPAKVPATQYGFDMSSHQTLDQAKAASADPKNGFAILKATEGMFYDDADHDAFVTEARARGLVVGHYHFAWPRNPSARDGISDPVGEAEHFLRVAKPQVGDLLALDLEDWGETDPGEPDYLEDKALRDACSWQDRVQYALAWLRYVREKTGAFPWVYANWYWIQSLRTAATPEEWQELVTHHQWLTDPFREPGQHEPIDPKPGTQAGWQVACHQYGTKPHDLNYMAVPTMWARAAVQKAG